MVLLGYFLCAEVLLHCYWVIRPSFDCGVVGNNDTLHSVEDDMAQELFSESLLMELVHHNQAAAMTEEMRVAP